MQWGKGGNEWGETKSVVANAPGQSYTEIAQSVRAPATGVASNLVTAKTTIADGTVRNEAGTTNVTVSKPGTYTFTVTDTFKTTPPVNGQANITASVLVVTNDGAGTITNTTLTPSNPKVTITVNVTAAGVALSTVPSINAQAGTGQVVTKIQW